MTNGIDQLIIGPLALRGDQWDGDRQAALTAVLTHEPNCANYVYNVAVNQWAAIAGRAYGEGERGPGIDKTMSEICQLCRWVNDYGMMDDSGEREGWHGNALIVFAQAACCLGRFDEALSDVRILVESGPSAPNWVPAAETMARILALQNDVDGCMNVVSAILEVDPENRFALNLVEAKRIDDHNKRVSAQQSSGLATPDSHADISAVNAQNFAVVSQKLAQDFQSEVQALMAGPLPMDEKLARIQTLQAQFEATMKALADKIQAA